MYNLSPIIMVISASSRLSDEDQASGNIALNIEYNTVKKTIFLSHINIDIWQMFTFPERFIKSTQSIKFELLTIAR
jgi:hypothetical protein